MAKKRVLIFWAGILMLPFFLPPAEAREFRKPDTLGDCASYANVNCYDLAANKVTECLDCQRLKS